MSDPRPGWFRIRNGIAPNAAAKRTLRVGGIIITCVTVGMLGMLARVIQLQTYPPAPVFDQIDSQHGRKTLQSRRGNLLDRRGRVIATSHIAHRLFVDPQLIQDPNTFSEQIGYRLGYDPARVEQMIGLKSHRRYVVIDPRINDERLAQLRAFRLRGLVNQPYVVRDYPLGLVAGQVHGIEPAAAGVAVEVLARVGGKIHRSADAVADLFGGDPAVSRRSGLAAAGRRIPGAGDEPYQRKRKENLEDTQIRHGVTPPGRR